jgi:hypothetical protein
LQCHLLVVVDFEDRVHTSDLKQILHSLFAHAITVDEIHARQIEQEVFVTIAGEDMYEVT